MVSQRLYILIDECNKATAMLQRLTILYMSAIKQRACCRGFTQLIISAMKLYIVNYYYSAMKLYIIIYTSAIKQRPCCRGFTYLSAMKQRWCCRGFPNLSTPTPPICLKMPKCTMFTTFWDSHLKHTHKVGVRREKFNIGNVAQFFQGLL